MAQFSPEMPEIRGQELLKRYSTVTLTGITWAALKMMGLLLKGYSGICPGCSLGTRNFRFCPGDSDAQPRVRTHHLAVFPCAWLREHHQGACQASWAGLSSQGFRIWSEAWFLPF